MAEYFFFILYKIIYIPLKLMILTFFLNNSFTIDFLFDGSLYSFLFQRIILFFLFE